MARRRKRGRREIEHERILRFLVRHFISYCNKHQYEFDVDLRVFLDAVESSCGKSQDFIAGEYTRVAREADPGAKEISQSKVSRAIPGINKKLIVFCDDCRIDPPIQMFNSIFEAGRIKPFGFFLACSKPLDDDHSTIATDIVPFRKAMPSAATSRIAVVKPDEPEQTHEALVEAFRMRLKEEALKHVDEKLHGRTRDDYRPLELEKGLVPRSGAIEEDMQPAPEDHSRQWQDFSYGELRNPHGIFILSSETGSGKTTFLRNLQLEIIEKTTLIPIFLEASTIDRLDFLKRDTDSFLLSVWRSSKHIATSSSDEGFLITHKDKAVFLIDGLDQIPGSGTEYPNLVDKLKGVIDNRLIIASRPFAVVDREKDEKFTFLRLKPFSEQVAHDYFGEKHERAKEMCRTCREMIHIPMLAYMVRHLIEQGRDSHVKNRTDIYRRFIDCFFEGEEERHEHENLRMGDEQRVKVRKAYRELSFKAIANHPPYLQSIPFDFAVSCKDIGVTIDDLFKYGVAHAIVNRTPVFEKAVYFSHRSFQEYLAAEYVARSDPLVEQVLREKWDPKWKEVLRVLTGLKGQGIIERILSEEDNVIHSKLFLAAELVLETEVGSELRDKMAQTLEALCQDWLFTEAARHLVYVGETKAMNWFMWSFEDENENWTTIHVIGTVKDTISVEMVEKIGNWVENENANVRSSAVYALGKLKNRVSDKLMTRIVSRLEDEDAGVRCAAIDTLGSIRTKIGDKIVGKIAGKLEDENADVRCTAIDALGAVKNRVRDEVMGKIVSRLDDENGRVRLHAVRVLVALRDRIDARMVTRIVSRLEDEDAGVRCAAIDALKMLKNRVCDEVIGKIVSRLDDEDAGVRCAAIDALGEFKHRISDELIVKIMDMVGKLRLAVDVLGRVQDRISDEVIEKIAGKLEDKNRHVRLRAVLILAVLKDMIDARMVTRIIRRLEDEDAEVRCAAIDALRMLEDGIHDEVIGKIVSRLDDEDAGVRRSGVEALRGLKDRIGNEIVEKIAGKLDDEDGDVQCLAVHTLAELSDRIGDKVIARITSINNAYAHKVLRMLYEAGKF